MIFSNIDEYEIYIEQIESENWEKLIMQEEKEQQFNEMMEEVNREIDGIKLIETTKKKKPYSKPTIKIIDKAVNQPSHYQFINMSVEDLIEKGLTHDELMGWFKGNIIKYRMRSFKKGKVGPQDIAKADEYQKFYDEYIAKNTP